MRSNVFGDNLELYVSNINGTLNVQLKFKDNATDTKIFARIATLSSYPLYYSECDLSKLKSSINITSNSETKLYTDGYYYINDSFSVAEQSLSKEITSIVVSYTNGSLETIYDGTNFVPFTSSDEGVYILTIVNKFGNKSLINVSYITKFSIVATANYFDGTNNIYSASYDGEINSNNSIELAVYTKHIEFSTTKDGNAITISTTDFNYGYKIIINEVGKYNFVITDEYGNTKNIVANIVNSTLNYNDNFITGFNEKALKKSDGYTNQKLSINLQAINDAGIKFISILKSNNSVIVMDNISEDKVIPTSDSLNNCIGNLGDGIYTITFKDNYGNSVEKTINYKETSTLSIYRETRTMEDSENVNIDKIENNSIYSNYFIKFTTSSSLFEFYVNDGKQDLPYTLQINSTDSESENQYKVTYVDEYGFNYSLNAYLILRNIEFNVGEDMGESGVSNIVKHEIYITFEDGLYSSYTINNGDSVDYISGTKLYSNGTYRFSIFDNAGNISNYTVIKDTEVEYMFYKDGTTSPLVSGEVVNSTRVYFKSLNGDESTYKKVLKDGNIQEDYSSSYFTETGKWEILLQDKVGNTSYFNFYIITHSLSTFEYTTPYEYKITDLKFDDGSGSKVNRIADVTSSTDNLHSECKFNENGTYYVSMKNSNTGSIKTFQIYIDKNAPKVTLNGVLNGESTSKDVTISGYSEGDTIKVYKDNVLIKYNQCHFSNYEITNFQR
jgi:hypothetical protein